jgi:hypothetical protein
VPEDDKDLFDAKNHMDWGSYYDPKNIFCGKYGETTIQEIHAGS